jgi:8-oxo-dGTP pyrophosphatase MutT (NUDIX family)
MADWQTESSEIIHETPWLKLRRDQLRNHNGKPMTYTYVELHHPGVAIIAMDIGGKILLQRNYRPTIKETVWEIPAGHSDGQDLLTAAQRELQEETGLASDDWLELGTFNIASGIANSLQRYFLARNVYPVSGDRDEEEQITDQQFFSVADIEAMLKRGEINSHVVPIGVYLAKIHGLTKKGK